MLKANVMLLAAVGMLPFTVPAGTPAAAPAAAPVLKAAADFKAASGVHRMIVSPDGKHLALGLEDGPLTLADAATLPPSAQVIKIEGGRAECMAFSPDSALLATGTFEGAYTLWKIPGGSIARRINGEGLAGAVGFSSDGRSMVTYPTGSGIGTWDLATGAKRSTLPLAGGGNLLPRDVVFSADAKTLALSGGRDDDHTVRVWDASTGKLRQHLKAYPKLVDRLALSADGGRLVTGSEDGMVRVWDLATAKSLGAWKVGGFVTAVAMSRDGKRIAASTDAEPNVHVWDLASASVLAQLPGHPDGARDLAFSPDGKRIYSAAFDRVKRWDLALP
jgi:WD40 repeat protein